MVEFKKKYYKSVVFLVELIIIILSYVCSFFLRFEGIPPQRYFLMMLTMLPVVIVIRVGILKYFNFIDKISQSVLLGRYITIHDLTHILKATTTSTLFIIVVVFLLQRGHPRSIFIIDFILVTLGLSGMKLSTQFTRRIFFRINKRIKNGHRSVLIVGAGDGGEQIMQEMIHSHSQRYKIVGFIDDHWCLEVCCCFFEWVLYCQD